jgi:hypothetical protein
MRLGFDAERVLSARSFAGFLQVAGEIASCVASNSLVIARGGVGMSPEPFARQDRHRQGESFLGALPFFFFQRSAAILRLRGMAKPPIWAHRFLEPLQSGL